MGEFKFWGIDASYSKEPSGAIGVLLKGKQMPNDTYEVAKRISAAGKAGLNVYDDDINFTHIMRLRDAGVEVRERGVGGVFIDELPQPSSYIVRAAPREKQSQQHWGQYGSTGIPKTWGG